MKITINTLLVQQGGTYCNYADITILNMAFDTESAKYWDKAGGFRIIKLSKI